MKVLMVTPYFYPKTGGMEHYAWHIAKGLKDTYGWEVIAIAANHKANVYKEEVLEGIKIYRLPILFKASNTPIHLTWYNHIAKIIEKEKPDIINGHTPVPFISDIAARVAKKKNLPFVLTYQNDLEKDSKLLQTIIKAYYTFMGNQTGQIATKIIATSDYYPTISNYLKQFKQKISVISPGVEMEMYEKVEVCKAMKNTYEHKKVVLFVGQLDKTHMHKGLHLLIKAVANVRKRLKSVQLVVIGKGDMIGKYYKLAEKAGIADRFEIVSNLDNEQLVSYYKISEVTVLPSMNKSEGFGMVLLEANACKKPVIGSTVGGIPFVIQNNRTGILIPSEDVNALSNSICKILTDKQFASQLGNNGYNRVKKEFTWNLQIKKTHDLYNKIIIKTK